MKENLKNLLIVVAASIALIGVIFWWSNLRGVGPVITKAPFDIADKIDENNNQPAGEAKNETDFPLTLPQGFTISVLARNISGARLLEFDSQGNLWVSRGGTGIITKLEIADNKVTRATDVFKNLDRPHGLAFDPQDPNILYVAEESKLSKVSIDSGRFEKLVDLPAGGGHSTRTVKVGPDNRLYVSIGSSCNVCDEGDERRAAIYVVNRDGSDFRRYAYGLRNSVDMAFSPVDGKMWATDNGRDLLGDNIPPEEVNLIEEGKNYGWPICYGNNVHDRNFDKKTYVRNPCMEPFEIPPKVEMQAHSAPLGLDFVPEEGWPEDMWYDLIVAFHGSWNRSQPTGYKLVRVKMDDKGNVQGVEDFITGWLTKDGAALGRPVEVLIQPGGQMYVTDDKAGLVYQISRNSID
jgi:glucose/arabinose dehydrogenase